MKPRQEVRNEFVRQWLDKAEADLGVAVQLIAANTPYRAIVAFHCQQAVEKFLKAFLVGREVEFSKTHNIEELLRLVAKVNAGMARLI
jgi:HEPN domain-containing protein